MRHCIFILLTSLLTTVCFAQSMSFSPNNDFYGMATLDNYNVFQIDIINETEESLQLSWKFLEDTTPEEWSITLCDNMNCFGFVPDNGIMNPILDDYAFIKLDVNPGSMHGEGTVSFLIFETDDQMASHEIRFHLSTLQVGNENIPQVEVEIFPIPANEFVMVESFENEDLQINITNTVGQQVHQSLLNAGAEKRIETSQFADGFYFLSLINDQKVISTKKIMVSH